MKNYHKNLLLYFSFFFFLFQILIIMNSCNTLDLEPVNASYERVTFDVVFEDNTWNGYTVYADLYDNSNPKKYIETINDVIEKFPNSTHYHVKLTTTSKIKTNEMYFLNIYIDLDKDGKKSTNDLETTIFGEVMAGYIYTEIHVFSSDLSSVQ